MCWMLDIRWIHMGGSGRILQTQNYTCCMIPLTDISRIGRFTSSQGLGRGLGSFDRDRVSVWDDEKVL